MERATIRDLHLKTSALLKEVGEGKTFIIEDRGVPVAELRPITERRIHKLPNREAFIRTLRPVKTDSGRIMEEDRS
jgi:antitoxin (DNA-binding transcriptional repressor) of toxin-antitoxin stability system